MTDESLDEQVEYFYARYVEDAAWLHARFHVGSMFMYLGQQFVVIELSPLDKPKQLFDPMRSAFGGFHPVIRAEGLIGDQFIMKVFEQPFLQAALASTAVHVADG